MLQMYLKLVLETEPRHHLSFPTCLPPLHILFTDVQFSWMNSSKSPFLSLPLLFLQHDCVAPPLLSLFPNSDVLLR